MENGSNPYLFEVNKIGNSSIGYISVSENSHLPFQVERVYWTYFTPHDVIRGNHAHKKLKQVLVAVTGQINVGTINYRGIEESFTLNQPNMCLFVPSMCWRTLQFSHNAVLMCLASEPFSEDDYIRDYKQFLSLINK